MKTQKIVYANCKINIGLDVLKKLSNGYHLVDMIMLPINLCDKLIINFSGIKGNLEIKTNKKNIPTDENNILVKTYKKFYSKSKIQPEMINVFLEKNIPHEAGLGGGSSDAAFFLRELNDHYNKPLTNRELITLAKELGADVPFFLVNKPARVTGIGEEIKNIFNNLTKRVILIKPNFGISTKDAYEGFKNLKEKKSPQIEQILIGLEKNNVELINSNTENVLEQSLLIGNEQIRSFKKKLEKITNKKFHMSGSGSAYFSLVSQEESSEIYEILKKSLECCEVFLCDFI